MQEKLEGVACWGRKAPFGNQFNEHSQNWFLKIWKCDRNEQTPVHELRNFR